MTTTTPLVLGAGHAAHNHLIESSSTPSELADQYGLTVNGLFAAWRSWTRQPGIQLDRWERATVWSAFLTAGAELPGTTRGRIIATSLVNRGAGVMPGRDGAR